MTKTEGPNSSAASEAPNRNDAIVKTAERPKPNWSRWLQLPSVCAWEAVALSLNIEPQVVVRIDARTANTMRLVTLFGRALRIGEILPPPAVAEGASCFDESQDFNSRLFVTVRNEDDVPSIGATAENDPASRRVRLTDFVALASACGWLIPDELKQLAPQSTKERRDLLDPAIDQAIAVGGPEPSVVFAELRKMAQQKREPFNSVAKDGQLIWTPAGGTPRKLSIKILRQRLKRRER